MAAIEWKPLEDIKDGDILAEDLYDGTSFKVLLSKGTRLNEEILKNLEKREILWLPIEGEKDEFEQLKTSIDFDEELLKVEEPIAPGIKLAVPDEMYRGIITSFKDLADQLKLGERIDTEAVERTLGSVVDDLITQDQYVVNLFRKHVSGYLYKHGINTSILSIMIGCTLSMSRYHLIPLAKAALFHDIGLMFLKDPQYVDIGKTSNRDKLLQHTTIGYKVLSSKGIIESREILDAVLEHHEKFDGTGIPFEKKGDDINFYARILQVADAYDSLTSTTSEALSLTPYQALKWILARSGKDYDPYILNAFIRVLGMYPTGTKVKLNDGKVGVVVRTSGAGLLVPVVLVDDFLIDLSKEKDIWIESVIE
ncbi:HD-GYP domain-containing protein [Mesoaciditoga lauensis]|uniref:HD-GYP domain-containing protein n=1 Tax=Mesoaciditoga lauensis TaxID=1495039 RepID=UPI00056D031B|nr:HD domain-containing phosphohydrolase [Mesoaciditoga lauensis]